MDLPSTDFQNVKLFRQYFIKKISPTVLSMWLRQTESHFGKNQQISKLNVQEVFPYVLSHLENTPAPQCQGFSRQRVITLQSLLSSDSKTIMGCRHRSGYRAGPSSTKPRVKVSHTPLINYRIQEG